MIFEYTSKLIDFSFIISIPLIKYHHMYIFQGFWYKFTVVTMMIIIIIINSI